MKNSIRGLLLFMFVYHLNLSKKLKLNLKPMNKNMIFDLLNKIGISLQPDSPPLMWFACGVFILAVLCLLSFINIILYITVIYISEHEYLLNKVKDKPRLLKFINFYKNIRIIYLALDVIFFLWCLIGIIRLCWRVIYALS
jgi:hypothetical protein